jgi:hypothetical protein
VLLVFVLLFCTLCFCLGFNFCAVFSIAVHGIELDSTVPSIGESAKPTPDEEFLQMHPKKTLEELLSSTEGGVFVVCAEIVRVVNGQDWWYPACKCHKGVSPDSGAYFCSSCNKHVFQVVPRFRVKLEVTDGKSTGVFILFDSDMSYIMEKSCAYFVAQSKVVDSCPEFHLFVIFSWFLSCVCIYYCFLILM